MLDAGRITRMGPAAEVLADPAAAEPVMAAVGITVRDAGIDMECFDRFFDAMALDLVQDTWASWEELRDGYMEGSAAVIGEMMLPVLRAERPTPAVRDAARALGLNRNTLRKKIRDLDIQVIRTSR